MIFMTMTVRYNGTANRALSHTNKNNKASSKALAKLASGLKINSAADDAASFSIGARMRVKLRALDQDSQNVQNGKAILNTAEGGIQGQIELLKTIREKVIDAANDSNTDEDRQTIQKELVHLYDEMESIAYGTDFNSKKPLLADKIVKLNEDYHTEVDNTKLNLIRDAEFEMLDSFYGPFAAFEEYSDSKKINLDKTTGYVAGTAGTPAVWSADFSSYSDVSQLNNVGIKIGGKIYVFTDDTSNNYRNATKIPLGSTVEDTLIKLKNYGITVDERKIKASGSITGASDAGGPGTTYTPSVTRTVSKAGVGGLSTSGGITNPYNDIDYGPLAAKATLKVDLSSSPSNSGFKFDGSNFHVLNPDATFEGSPSAIQLIKGQSLAGKQYTSSFEYTFDGKYLTFTARYDGDGYNSRSISDGYTYDAPTPIDYTAYTAFSGTTQEEEPAIPGTPATPGSATLELAGMTFDDFRNKYAGKILEVFGSKYKFYDSSLESKLESFIEEMPGSRAQAVTQIDINNDLRSSGQSLAQALRSRIGGTVDGENLKFTYNANGAEINLIDETLRHYDIDFSNLNVKIPAGLYGKGFRAYCATDDKEWFNFVFTDGINSYDSDLQNIKSINIDVSAVTNAAQLVQTIFDQAQPILTKDDDKKFNHHMRLAVDGMTLTIYDRRRFNVNRPPYVYQNKGAKIADGVSFKEVYENERRNFSVKELVIQHTDRADMNIKIKIPQMTLDHIFDPLPDYGSTIFDYPVTSKDSRDALLGKPNPPGILDIGLKYLLDAATMVGAQNRRLEFTATNITTEMENLTASESVISDADMAKEMTEYTKYNILSQSSQAMLAQANQSQSMVLSLLQ